MLGQRLRLARKKAGLSMQQLADHLSPSVSVQAISKYESGMMMPRSAVLMGLGKTLGVSLDFLMGGQVEALHRIEFRKHSRTSAKDLALVEAMVTEQLEDYLTIEDILEIASPSDLFGELRCDQVTSFEEVDIQAQALRDDWHLGYVPIPSMAGLLERKGIKVIEADFPEHCDGLACSVKRTGGKPDTEAILISGRTNIEHKRFNLAYDLARRVIRGTDNRDIKIEKAMHRFASAFLVPAEGLREEVGGVCQKISYCELIRLKRFYGISAAGMLIRLRDVGILSEGTVGYAFRTYARPWRTNEPEPIAKDEGLGAFEKPLRFERLVWRAVGDELIAPVRAAQLLKRPLNEVEISIRGGRWTEK